MLEWLRFGLSALLTGFGLFALISAVLGVFRFRYALSRIHAAALTDTLGIGAMLLGLMLAFGLTDASLKLLAVIAFLWLTSPVASHLIGKLEVTTNDELSRHMEIVDEALVRREKEAE